MFKTILALQKPEIVGPAVNRPIPRGGITDPVQEIKLLKLRQQ